VRCSRVHRSGRKPDASHNQAVGLGLPVRVLALALLFASVASPQILETTIALPDSLGPLTGTTHVAFDEDPVHPRMFIGGEGGDVLVVDALTCERLARIATGPVASICYSPKHNKLYTTTVDEDVPVLVEIQ
jgi:hypothetical protein